MLVATFDSNFEGVRRMKEIIIVAGKSKSDICWLRHCLRVNGYSSIPCKSVEQIIEELEILPTCGVTVSLVIIEPEILSDIGDDLVAKLTDLALDVSFLLSRGGIVEADWAETFEKICEYRTQFKHEHNPKLAEALMETDVEVACG